MKDSNVIILMALEYCLSQENPTGLSVFNSYIIESNIDEELKLLIKNRLKKIEINNKGKKQYTYNIALSLLNYLTSEKNDLQEM
jgi:hypothetical protein